MTPPLIRIELCKVRFLAFMKDKKICKLKKRVFGNITFSDRNNYNMEFDLPDHSHMKLYQCKMRVSDIFTAKETEEISIYAGDLLISNYDMCTVIGVDENGWIIKVLNENGDVRKINGIKSLADYREISDTAMKFTKKFASKQKRFIELVNEEIQNGSFYKIEDELDAIFTTE